MQSLAASAVRKIDEWLGVSCKHMHARWPRLHYTHCHAAASCHACQRVCRTPSCTNFFCRFGSAFGYILSDPLTAEKRHNAAELDSPNCHYSAIGCMYKGGALTPLEKSFVQACIAEDPAQH
jgi:hypothetical protein